MRRIVAVLSVMAVMLAMSVAPAFAAGEQCFCAKQLAKIDPISIRACLGHS
jgi:hypothetical protein